MTSRVKNVPSEAAEHPWGLLCVAGLYENQDRSAVPIGHNDFSPKNVSLVKTGTIVPGMLGIVQNYQTRMALLLYPSRKMLHCFHFQISAGKKLNV